LIDEEAKVAAAVDPAEPTKVLEAAQREGVRIESILTTHHHLDHAGGNEEFKKQQAHVAVYGGDDRIGALTNKVQEGDQFKVGGLEVQVHFTPCHTSGHVLYFVRDPKSNPPAIFTGDTLFIGGCGRFFEGTAQQMYHALCEVVASLPKETRVYCGHEYTVKNLEFALSIEPDNDALKKKMDWCKEQRANGKPTIPSTVEEELSFNPFMRVAEKTVAGAVGLQDPIKIMDELRRRKNNFK